MPSFNNVKNPDTVSAKANNVTIQPAIGFAADTNTIVGISLLYATETNKYYTINPKRKSFGAGVFFRKYKPLGKNFYLFGESGLQYYHSSYNYSSKILSSMNMTRKAILSTFI